MEPEFGSKALARIDYSAVVLPKNWGPGNWRVDPFDLPRPQEPKLEARCWLTLESRPMRIAVTSAWARFVAPSFW